MIKRVTGMMIASLNWGGLHLVELAVPGDRVSPWKLDRLGNLLLRFRSGAAQVSLPYAEPDGDIPFSAFPVDEEGSIGQFDLRHHGQRDPLTIGRIHEKPLDFLQRFAVAAGKPEGEAKGAFPFQDRGNGIPANGVDNEILNIRHVKAETGAQVPVDGHIQRRLTQFPVDTDIDDPTDGFQDLFDLHRFGMEDFQIGPDEFYRILPLHPGERFGDIILNILRKGVFDSRNLVQMFVQALDDSVLGDAFGPLVGMFHEEAELDVENRCGIRAVIGPTDLNENIFDLGLLQEDLLEVIGKFGRIAQVHRIGQRHANPEVVLLKRRQISRSQTMANDQGSRDHNEGDCEDQHRPADQ